MWLSLYIQSQNIKEWDAIIESVKRNCTIPGLQPLSQQQLNHNVYKCVQYRNI